MITAGKNPAKGESFVRKLTDADLAMLDVEQREPLNGLKPRAILTAVNDPHDYLLMDAIQRSIPVMDIKRWTIVSNTAPQIVSALQALRHYCNHGLKQGQR